MQNASRILAYALILLAYRTPAAETNHNFARWEKDIAAFERMDRTNPPPQGGLLFIGSSTIRFWTTLANDFPGQPVINRGFGGSEILDATHFADRIVFPYKPKLIFLRAGGNDLWAGKTPEQVFQDYKDFVKTVHSRLPESQIVFISLSPSIKRWTQAEKEKAVNGMVEELVRENRNLKYIDTWSVPLDKDGTPKPELFRDDQLHFNAAGYRLLVERVRPFVPK
jgi:lysophospholipase L1-like esterase